jgi:uncharacterized protein (DUF1015 family)
MVEIAPFDGLSYNLKKIRDISKTLAPPYDIISEKQRDILEKQDPYNIVNLTLPRESPSDTRYENSKILLDKWIDDEILIHEKKKCFYVFDEEFLENEERKHFTGFIGLLRVEEYAAGKVLRHEKTLPKPKEDRFNLLKATRSNLEFIYTLYNDADKRVFNILNNVALNPPLISTKVEYDPGLFFKLWRIDEKADLNRLIQLMENKSLLIADGHHRYETSRLYKENSGKKLDLTDPENYILALFVSSTQKDISIHPTHRLIRFRAPFKPLEIIKKLEDYFSIEILEDPGEAKIARKMNAAIQENNKIFCLYFGADKCFFITLKDSLINIYKKSGIDNEEFDEEFEYLDVNILHKLVLQLVLGTYEIEDVKFVHTINEVINSIDNNKSQHDALCFNAGFILNPPSISIVEKLSNEGKIMPQKSTYFYPKPCSGLVIYKFDI